MTRSACLPNRVSRPGPRSNPTAESRRVTGRPEKTSSTATLRASYPSPARASPATDSGSIATLSRFQPIPQPIVNSGFAERQPSFDAVAISCWRPSMGDSSARRGVSRILSRRGFEQSRRRTKYRRRPASTWSRSVPQWQTTKTATTPAPTSAAARVSFGRGYSSTTCLTGFQAPGG
jgi:hypothetical protein